MRLQRNHCLSEGVKEGGLASSGAPWCPASSYFHEIKKHQPLTMSRGLQGKN